MFKVCPPSSPTDTYLINAKAVLKDNEEKKRNFVSTVELQIGLKNYDPQRDKRFSGSIKLPTVPKPRMSVCILGDQHDIDRAKHHGGMPSCSLESAQSLILK
jgi:ribosomal protein L1